MPAEMFGSCPDKLPKYGDRHVAVNEKMHCAYGSRRSGANCCDMPTTPVHTYVLLVVILESSRLSFLMSSTPPAQKLTRPQPRTHSPMRPEDPLGGNPAVIIFLDLSDTLTQEQRLKSSYGLKQPMAAFLTQTSTSIEKPGVFAPVLGVNEDHVCGSTNCIMGP